MFGMDVKLKHHTVSREVGSKFKRKGCFCYYLLFAVVPRVIYSWHPEGVYAVGSLWLLNISVG